MNENLINWNDFYSVGDDLMDKEHKDLIDIVNKLFIAFKQGRAHELSNKILDEMETFTKVHFASEERLMERINYSEIIEHKKLHQLLLNKVQEFRKKAGDNSKSLHYEIIEFLKQWWTEHVLKEDMKYAKFLKNE